MFFDDELPELIRRVSEIARVGTVSEVDGEGRSLVRVRLGIEGNEEQELISDFLPLLQIASPLCAVWVAPRKGEQVLVLCPNGSTARGFAIRGIYHGGKSPRKEPEAATDKNIVVEFEDGTNIIYDDKGLQINAKADINLITDKSVKIESNSKIDIIASKQVNIESDKVFLGKGVIKTGLVTQECKCIMTGSPHIEASTHIMGVK